MSFELTSNAPPADWQQFQELFRETEYTDDSDNHFNYCTICLYIIPDLAQAKLIDAQVRDQINKTLYTNIELGGLVCGYCYDNYAKSTADQSSWPIAEDDLMSIDDTLFDPEKEQLDQAAVKHHLQPSATTTAVAYATNNSNAKNSAGVPLPGLYNVVETSEFFHSHESDSHVLNYSEHDYDTSYVTDSAGISDLSSVLPVDVTFSAPAQLYHPHVTPYWTEHVTNHVTDQRVTPVKRRDLNEIASMKLPELKTELKRYRLSTKGTKPQLVQRLFRHLSLFHSHVPGHVPDNAPFIFAELQDGNETAQPWSMSRDRPNESLTALFEDDRSEQESYLALKERALVAHQARDTQPLDLSSLSLLSLPEIKARLAQYTGASIKGSKAELIQRLVRYSCLFAVPK